MDNESRPERLEPEQHWRKGIAAVQGSPAAEVWFEARHQGGSSPHGEEPQMRSLVGAAPRSDGEDEK